MSRTKDRWQDHNDLKVNEWVVQIYIHVYLNDWNMIDDLYIHTLEDNQIFVFFPVLCISSHWEQVEMLICYLDSNWKQHNQY